MCDEYTPIRAIGLMTGTVLDGNIDIAMLTTDGERIAEFGRWSLAPYPPGLRDLLVRTLSAATDWAFEGPEPAIFAEAEDALTRGQSAAVTSFLADAGIAPAEVGVIGFHGQTVLHRAPRDGRTRRHAPARRRRIDGDADRHRRGARLPHRRRARGRPGRAARRLLSCGAAGRLDAPPTTAVLNLGGVANVTWRGHGGRLVAFDTGPANAPINDWVERATGSPMDRDGALARAGAVDEARLARLLQHDWLFAPPPKSLDRNDFRFTMAEGLSLEDGAATLTAFTAGAVGRALDLLPIRPTKLVLCGGGRRNPALVNALRVRAGVEPVLAEDARWRGDAIEAECFAFLAVRALRGLPISFPGTTARAGADDGRAAAVATTLWPGTLGVNACTSPFLRYNYLRDTVTGDA